MEENNKNESLGCGGGVGFGIDLILFNFDAKEHVLELGFGRFWLDLCSWKDPMV